MSLIAAWPGSERIDPLALPGAVRIAFTQIEASPFAVRGSIAAYRTTIPGRTFVITCEVRWHIPAAIKDARIQQPELVAWWFSDEDETAAPELRSDREDFPRDLPHLNEVTASEPVSICLAREGATSLYRRAGMAGLLDRAAAWFGDAAAQRLDHDGWEPLPTIGRRSAVLDVGWFQRYARGHSPKQAGYAAGSALVFAEPLVGGNEKIHFQLVPKRKHLKEVWTEEAKRDSSRHSVGALWLFAWGPQREPVGTRFTERVDGYDSLIRFAEHSRCGDAVRRCLNILCNRPSGSKAAKFLLLIGTWRPRALIAGVPGLAQGAAAALELSGFEVAINAASGKASVSSVERMRLVSDATPTALREIAGRTRTLRRAVMVGAGALGSKVAEHLAREGLESILIVDNERFEPHNLARHALDRSAIHFAKAFELADHLRRIVPEIDAAGIPVNAARCKAGEFPSVIPLTDQDVIIDATANMDVTTRLCAPDVPCHRAIKIEIADEGRLCLVYVEGAARNPRLDDLKAMVPYLSMQHESISQWLRRQPGKAIVTGIGCASASMRMPDSQVSLHAANLMPVVTAVLSRRQTAGIGVAWLGRGGHLSGWKWFDVRPFVQLPPRASPDDRTLRVSSEVLDELEKVASRASPLEAGGYLYGHYDAHSRVIHIVWVVNPTPLEASPNGIRLPPAASTEEELHALGASGDHLRLLGTWHSHPGASSHPSNRDLLQWTDDVTRCTSRASPHVVLIHGRDGWRSLIGVPALWG